MGDVAARVEGVGVGSRCSGSLAPSESVGSGDSLSTCSCAKSLLAATGTWRGVGVGSRQLVYVAVVRCDGSMQRVIANVMNLHQTIVHEDEHTHGLSLDGLGNPLAKGSPNGEPFG